MAGVGEEQGIMPRIGAVIGGQKRNRPGWFLVLAEIFRLAGFLIQKYPHISASLRKDDCDSHANLCVMMFWFPFIPYSVFVHSFHRLAEVKPEPRSVSQSLPKNGLTDTPSLLWIQPKQSLEVQYQDSECSLVNKAREQHVISNAKRAS